MTRFQLHCQTWKDGCGSAYCATAMRKVFYRGDIPCDILFVGEAPGKSENIKGIPFVKAAPSGGMLNRIVERSIPKHRQHKTEPAGHDGELAWCPVCKKGEVELITQHCLPYRIGYTNVVSCIPRAMGEEKAEPDQDQMDSCKPRLEEMIEIANPRLIIAVGDHSWTALRQGYLHSVRIPTGVTVVPVRHPGWILRQSVAFQGLEIQRVCHTIRDAIRRLEKKADDNLQNRDARGFPVRRTNTAPPKSAIMDDPDEPIPF